MINEYLFPNKSQIEELNNYNPVSITKKSIEIKNTELLRVSFSIEEDDFINAEKLSEVHDYMKKFEQYTQKCESSAFYNKELFPLINSFERKLRELLYLAFFISKSNNTEENKDKKDSKTIENLIKNIDEKDFNTIFETLFIDKNYSDKVFEKIKNIKDNGSKPNFTKFEVEECLIEFEENLLWDKIFNEQNVLPDLKKNFRKLKAYRNDVMHAHNINKEKFSVAKSLFEKINEQIDNKIKEMTKEPKIVNKNFNNSLFTSLSPIMLPDLSKCFPEEVFTFSQNLINSMNKALLGLFSNEPESDETQEKVLNEDNELNYDNDSQNPDKENNK